MNLFKVPQTDEVLFQKDEYVVLKGNRQDGFIVWNRKYPFEQSHAHVYGMDRAKQIVLCAIANKIPPRANYRFKKSIERLTVVGDL